MTISELGRGAYGVVEKVRHAQSGTIMAVKVLQWQRWLGGLVPLMRNARSCWTAPPLHPFPPCPLHSGSGPL